MFQERTHKALKSASPAVLSKVLLTLHTTRWTPLAASGLIGAMFARPRICTDASIRGDLKTGMHDSGYPPPKILRSTLPRLDKIQDLMQLVQAFHIRLDLVEGTN